MKKLLIALIVSTFAIGAAHADCVATTTYSCESGYYLVGRTNCVKCPSFYGVDGQTPDKNTGGITSCRMPLGTYTDETGTFIMGNCNYSE